MNGGSLKHLIIAKVEAGIICNCTPTAIDQKTVLSLYLIFVLPSHNAKFS